MRLPIAIFALCVVLATLTSPARGAPDEMPLSRFELQGGKAPLPKRSLALPKGIASLSASECEGCHVTEAREWQGSQHRQSWTSALFQDAYRIEPMPECRNCHQPLTAGEKPTAARSSPAAALSPRWAGPGGCRRNCWPNIRACR